MHLRNPIKSDAIVMLLFSLSVKEPSSLTLLAHEHDDLLPDPVAKENMRALLTFFVAFLTKF